MEQITIQTVTTLLVDVAYQLFPLLLVVFVAWILLPHVVQIIKEELVRSYNRSKLIKEGIISIDKMIEIDGFKGTVTKIGNTHVRLENGKSFGYFSISSLVNGKYVIVPKYGKLLNQHEESNERKKDRRTDTN